MPDGHEKIYGAQVIYSNVTRKHSGTYVCEGSNGSGYIATDTIKIDVIRKYIFSMGWKNFWETFLLWYIQCLLIAIVFELIYL